MRFQIPTGLLSRFDQRITVSFYVVSVVLIIAVSVGFSVVYRENFQSFIERLRYLLEVDTNDLADRVSPYLAHMGAHEVLITVVPSDIAIIPTPVSVENPNLLSLRQGEMALDGRIDRIAVMQSSNELGNFLYVLGVLDGSPLQTREIGATNMFGSDYLVLRYESTRGLEHRYVGFESLEQARDTKVAELVAFVGSRDLKPLTLSDDDRDSDLRGGAYRDGEQTYLLIRLVVASPDNSSSAPGSALADRPVSIALGSNDPGRQSYAIPSSESSQDICNILNRLQAFTVPQSVDEAHLRVADERCEIPLDKANQSLNSGEDADSGLFSKIHFRLFRKDTPNSYFDSGRPDAIGVSVPMSIAYAKNAELHATRGFSSIMNVWGRYSNFQIVSFSIPMVGIALIVFMFDFAVIRRIRRLARETRKFGGPAFTSGELEKPDEIGQLARRIDEVTGKLKQQKKMLEQTARRIRHDIKAPLDRLETLIKDKRAKHLLERARHVVDEVVEDQEIQRETAPLSIVEFVDTWCVNTFTERNVEGIEFDRPNQDIWVRVYSEGLEDTLEQLLNNACDFRHNGTPITLAIEPQETTAKILFRNEGPLIPGDDINEIFNFGHCRRPESMDGHHGYGLYQARRYIVAMGGKLNARNWERGAEFVIELQRASSPALKML